MIEMIENHVDHGEGGADHDVVFGSEEDVFFVGLGVRIRERKGRGVDEKIGGKESKKSEMRGEKKTKKKKTKKGRGGLEEGGGTKM